MSVKNFLQVFLILITFIIVLFVFSLTWFEIILAVNKVYLKTNIPTPSYLLTVLEKETSFASFLGYYLNKDHEVNIKNCVDYCWAINFQGVYCDNLQQREQWCRSEYNKLLKIISDLRLNYTDLQTARDFGMGYTQFQPSTWLDPKYFPYLKDKNPWNIEDALEASAIKIKIDGVDKKLLKVISQYNPNPSYENSFNDLFKDWEQILQDTIFVYDCSNNYSCALSVIKDRFLQCTENNWSVKQKKDCLKTEVAKQKQVKLANLEKQKQTLEIKLIALSYKESTSPYLGQILFQPTSTSNLKLNIQPEDQTITYKEEKKEDIITYQEEKREIKNITTSYVPILNTPTLVLTTTTVITSTPTSTSISITTTSTSTQTTLSLRQQIVPTSTNNLVYIGGGTVNQNTPSTDPCEDYKNKQYPNILISEIQYETVSSTDDEFIEFYNPTNQEIDLTCWKLEKYASKDLGSTSTPNLYTLIPQSKFKSKIKPNSFFLITSSSTKEKYNGDIAYAESYSISKNNTIILRKPNGEISDLVGYGDDKEKIYQYETEPFIINTQTNADYTQTDADIINTIQRKNLQDTNNNSNDFYLRKPNPENSTITRLPRQDFTDLSQTKINDFQVFSTSTEETAFLNIFFQEPSTTISTSTNYFYDLLISTSTNFSTFKLKDFGASSTFPQPKLDGSTTTLTFEITKCPIPSTLYYFALFLKDKLDEENFTFAASSTTLPDYLCNPPQISTSTSTSKILISEIRIIEGTSTGEYIELYNPNDFDIDLTGWKLIKINQNLNEEPLFSATPTSKYFLKAKIKPFSFILLSNSQDYLKENFNLEPDIHYYKNIDLAKNNKLKLIAPNNNIVDFAEWNNFENELILLRKAGKESNVESMKTWEKDFGNSYDNEENLNEFLIFDIPEPQNSGSTSEIPPNYLTSISLKTQGQKIIVEFRSPYRISGNNTYELRKSTTTGDLINITLPPVEKYGQLQKIEFNGCQYNLQNDDHLYLLLIKDNQIIDSKEIAVSNLNCQIFAFDSGNYFLWGACSSFPCSYIEKIAQEVDLSNEVFIKRVKVKMMKEPLVDDKVWISIFKDGTKPEEGSLIATSSLVDNSLVPLKWESNWVEFNFNGLLLTPAKYYFVLQRERITTDLNNRYYAFKGNDMDYKNKLWLFIVVSGGWSADVSWNYAYKLAIIIE